MRVVHEKTREENRIPLLDPETGTPLYPELMAELDAVKRERTGGLMLRRGWSDGGPWPTWPQPDVIDLTHMSRKVKEVMRAAGLARRTQLRLVPPWRLHGGGRRRELTDAQIPGTGPAQVREGAPQVCQADLASGGARGAQTAGEQRHQRERSSLLNGNKAAALSEKFCRKIR